MRNETHQKSNRGGNVKFQIECPECIRLGFKGDLPSKPHQEWVTIDDSGWFEFTCPSGHSTVIALQNLKFDLLFETGAYALLDGYPREAVATFSAALERYYEFHLTVLAINKGMRMDSFDAAWKLVSKRSERQLGAYLLSHAFEFGESPPSLPKKPDLQKFRNDVIHNGLIPTEREAIDFGDAVLKVIRAALAKLRSIEDKQRGFFAQAYCLDMARRCPEKFRIKPHSTTCVITIASPVMATPTDRDLDAALKRLRLFRHTWMSSLDPKPNN